MGNIVDRIEWFDDRFYKVGEDFYPSVTTVLGIIDKPFLRKWYADLGYEKAVYRSKLAMEKGSRIHDGIYDLLQKGYVHSDSWAQEDYYQLWNFVKFYESLKPKVLANELIVVSHEIRCAGTLDLLIEIEGGSYDTGYAKPIELDGGVYLIDIKTGGFYPEYHYQTSAYAQMCIEDNIAKDIKGTMILQTNADTKKQWKLIQGKDWREDYKHFLSALDLFNASGDTKPKVFDMPKELFINEIYQNNGTNN